MCWKMIGAFSVRFIGVEGCVSPFVSCRMCVDLGLKGCRSCVGSCAFHVAHIFVSRVGRHVLCAGFSGCSSSIGGCVLR